VACKSAGLPQRLSSSARLVRREGEPIREPTTRDAQLLIEEERHEPDDDTPRELAHRAGDGIDVSLWWSQRTNRVTVKVYDARFDEGFELEVDGRKALDAYCHPFAYAAAQTKNRTLPSDALAA
jgi:hypothetical protein